MSLDRFIESISERLLLPLPGLQAQLRMSSMRRLQELMGAVPPAKATPSGVLLLIYPIADDPCMVFIQRSDYSGVHSGQISFPGGKREPADPDILTTALRESHEEVGVIPGDVNILGRLSDLYIPPSRFLVTPFVGYCRYRPEFIRDPSEVKEVIEVRIGELFSDEACKVMSHRVGLGIRFKAPAFVVNGHVIWGATAMILNEFKEVVKEGLAVQ